MEGKKTLEQAIKELNDARKKYENESEKLVVLESELNGLKGELRDKKKQEDSSLVK